MSDLVGLHLPKVNRALAVRIKQCIESGKPFKIELHGTEGAVLSGDITERFKMARQPRQLTAAAD